MLRKSARCLVYACILWSSVPSPSCARAGGSSARPDAGSSDAHSDGVTIACGDGVIGEGEECDDGNRLDGDGCGPDCTVEPGWTCTGQPSTCTRLCGNGHRDPGEECDGTDLGGASCSDADPRFTGGTLRCTNDCRFDTSGCRSPNCGDGVVDPDEDCDDGNTSNEDACLNNCRHARCGDGYVWRGHEECDDGNSVSGDGCEPSSCTFTCRPGDQEACGQCGTRTCQATHVWGPCEEYCAGRECGPDPCGGSCGTCPHWWLSCTSSGRCDSICADPPCLADVFVHGNVAAHGVFCHLSSTCAADAIRQILQACNATTRLTGCDDGSCGRACASQCAECSCSSPSGLCPTVNTCPNCTQSFLQVDAAAGHAWPTFSSGILVAGSGVMKDYVLRYYYEDPSAPKPYICIRETNPGVSGCLNHCGQTSCIPGTDLNHDDHTQAAGAIQVLADGDRLVLTVAAWTAWGLMATAQYFAHTMSADPTSYTHRWYVLKWTDGNGNQWPDPPGTDTYQLLTYGDD